MDIGSRIKELRLQSGLSTTKLSKLSGVSSGYISELENNIKSPSIDTLLKILSVLNISMAAFFDEYPSEVLKPELRNLIESVSHLDTNQIDLLSKFLQSLKSNI